MHCEHSMLVLHLSVYVLGNFVVFFLCDFDLIRHCNIVQDLRRI